MVQVNSGFNGTSTRPDVSPTEKVMKIPPTAISPTSPPFNAAAVVISSASTIPANPPSASTVLTTSGDAVTTTAKTNQHVYNVSGNLMENDEIDHSILAAFSDIQTVFLACISTLLPLIVALGIAFGVRLNCACDVRFYHCLKRTNSIPSYIVGYIYFNVLKGQCYKKDHPILNCGKHVWRKYRDRRNNSNGLPWYKGVCSRETTVESLHHRPHSGSITIEPATRILSAQDLVNGLDGIPRCICETEVIEDMNVATNGLYSSPENHTSKNSNGNIITLTLKNNHLIVETEEREVTPKDNKNQNYQENSCSFVVEVQPEDYRNDAVQMNEGSSNDLTQERVTTDQQALVHQEEVPDDQTSEYDNVRLFGSTNTGLSQSDLSVSSQGSVNPSYRYGNQMEYDEGHLGYPMYGGSYDSNTLPKKLEGRSKWVEFDKSPDTEKTLLDEKDSSITDKQYNIDSGASSIEHQDSTDASAASTDTVRSNPNLQMNGATPNKLEIMKQKAPSTNDIGKSESNKPIITGALLKEDAQEDTFQEQQRKLGNGMLTPEHKDDIISSKPEQKPEGSSFVPSHKRTGSIPPRLIEETLEIDRKKSFDIYNQIKTSTKNILPATSPKFELLQNDVSPIEDKES